MNNHPNTIARGFSWNEWQHFSPAERQRIFQEREKQNRSVATMQTSFVPVQNQSNTFISDDNAASVHAGQTRGVQQAS
jgi:hypothetical protein